MTRKLVNTMLKYGLGLSGVMLTTAVFAAGGTAVDGSLATLADNVTGNLSAVAKLITAGSYVAGFGFAVGSIIKFKAHKDNPTQVPIGMPIALLFIGAALIFIPSVMSTSGKTLFGSNAQTAGVSGIDSFSGSS